MNTGASRTYYILSKLKLCRRTGVRHRSPVLYSNTMPKEHISGLSVFIDETTEAWIVHVLRCQLHQAIRQIALFLYLRKGN